MGAPAHERTWTFSLNHDESGASVNDTCKNAYFRIKSIIAGFSAWSVVASSNASSVKNIGDASPDLWSSTSDITFAGEGVAHSWVVLENSVTGVQICIDCIGATYTKVRILCSHDGSYNTDGTTTDRPTAGYDLFLVSHGFHFISPTTDGAVVHGMISDDNKSTRIIVHQRDGSNNGDSILFLEGIADPIASWEEQERMFCPRWQADVNLSTTNTLKDPRLSIYGSNFYVSPVNGLWISVYPTSECYNAFGGDAGTFIASIGQDQDWSGGYPVNPIGLYKAGYGSMGRLRDLYFANTNHDTYDLYDEAGSKDWIKIGCFLLPWDGSSTPLEVP